MLALSRYESLKKISSVSLISSLYSTALPLPRPTYLVSVTGHQAAAIELNPVLSDLN